MAIHVLILRPSSVLESSLALSSDILGTANQISQSMGTEVPFSLQVIESADILRKKIGNFDLVILPGLGCSTADSIENYLGSNEAQNLSLALQHLRKTADIFASSCTGVFAFAQAGLLKNRRVTTTWWLSTLFRRRYPETTLEYDKIVIEDDGIFTAGAAFAHIDLMLKLVEYFASAEIAAACSSYLLADRRESQEPYISLSAMINSDPQLRRAQSYILKNLKRELTVAQIAKAGGLSPRTFSRRLKQHTDLSPIHFLQKIRVLRATQLVRQTQLSVEEIAERVGYSDASALRRVVKKHLGETLGTIRRTKSKMSL